MKPLLWAIGLGVASSLSVAQLTVENPKHLDYPEAKAKVLLSTACRVVAEEFHAQDQSEVVYPLTLVLGVKDEYWTEDEEGHNYTLYLKDWNEAKFAVAAMRLALQRLVTHDRGKQLIREILQRSDQLRRLPRVSYMVLPALTIDLSMTNRATIASLPSVTPSSRYAV